jgi:hypothetical protein
MKILISGDSFAFGQGCSDRLNGQADWKNSDGPSRFCWASLLQQTYPEITVVNRALPGLDNTSILIETSTACTENTFDLIIFAGTYIERKQIAHFVNPDQITTWSPGWKLPGSNEYQKAQEYYLKYLTNITMDTNITVSNVLAAYGLASKLGAKFLWSLPDFPPDDKIMYELLDFIKDHRFKAVQAFDFSGTSDFQINQQYECLDRHITDAGHKLYFERQIVPLFKELKIIS